MALQVERRWKDSKGKEHITSGAPEWKYLSKLNDICPGCGKQIFEYDNDVEYSKTKRGTHVFWHSGCTEKVWH